MKRALRWWSAALTLALGASVLAPARTVTANDGGTQSHGESIVIFKIGSPVYTVDGKQYEMDVAPRIDAKSGRTLLPVRYTAQALDAAVYYNDEGQRITIVHNETQRVLDLTVGDARMRVTDSESQFDERRLDQEPVIDPPGRTMLPVRAVAEALYGKVSFDPDTQQIVIVRPASHPPTKEPAADHTDFGEVIPTIPENSHEHGEEHGAIERPVLITNRGEGPLFVDGAVFEGNGVFGLCSERFQPFVLKPGESRAVNICLNGTRPGTFKEVLFFKSRVELPNDLRIRPITITVIILGCRVRIQGGGLRPDINTAGNAPLPAAGIDDPLVNVGQQMSLQAVVSGLFGPYTYQWTVAGAHVKDYQELTTGPWTPSNMNPGDYTGASIGYYWRQVGGFPVTVKVTNSLGFTCSATKNFTVERNAANPNRQAEDFYTWNHGSAVLREHFTWHNANPYVPCAAVGTPFFTFHRDYLQRFQAWRAFFGYAPALPWNSGTPLPGGVANFHAARAGFYNPGPNAVPSYLTAAGGALASPCFGANNKAAFPNVNAFWIEVQGPWHNNVHGAIGGWGGDMSSTARAPKDPIFWRFHLLINGL